MGMFCIECGQKISPRSTRCQKCANTLKNKDITFRKKVSLANKGRIFSDTWKANLRHSRQKLKLTGENNPNWRGGTSFEPYSVGWTSTYKEQIRYRDRYKCQCCGKTQKENKKKLSVHHIDYDKTNILPENLISLCNRCHSKTNYNREYWIKYFSFNVQDKLNELIKGGDIYGDVRLCRRI